jgi:hypothetical protein
MENLFNLFKELLIVHNKYKGVVCGYDDSRFILAVETSDDKNFFRKFRKEENAFILEKYKDTKYRYIYENESEILKQIKK